MKEMEKDYKLQINRNQIEWWYLTFEEICIIYTHSHGDNYKRFKMAFQHNVSNPTRKNPKYPKNPWRRSDKRNVGSKEFSRYIKFLQMQLPHTNSIWGVH